MNHPVLGNLLEEYLKKMRHIFSLKLDLLINFYFKMCIRDSNTTVESVSPIAILYNLAEYYRRIKYLPYIRNVEMCIK